MKKLVSRLYLFIALIALLGCDEKKDDQQLYYFYSGKHNILLSRTTDQDTLNFMNKNGVMAETTLEDFNEYLGVLTDYYLDYWVDSRENYNAQFSDISNVRIYFHMDCTYPTTASYNGLAAGLNYGEYILVTSYRLKRSKSKPAGWDEGLLLNPRTSEEMQALSARNGQYWVNEESNNYYWCDLPNTNMGAPAMMHEWDHSIESYRNECHEQAWKNNLKQKQHTFSYQHPDSYGLNSKASGSEQEKGYDSAFNDWYIFAPSEVADPYIFESEIFGLDDLLPDHSEENYEHAHDEIQQLEEFLNNQTTEGILE